jgi:signal transduction histidine kinase
MSLGPLRWPRSLVWRVFALYSLALFGFVLAGLVLFFHHQFTVELEDTHARAEGLVAVMSPAISDSAVIGDYDTIRRTLDRTIRHSDFASAAFIDRRGAVVRADAGPQAGPQAPDWLTQLLADRLYQTNQTISVGGRDYGVLRLQFAPERIAGALWQQGRVALLLVLLALAGGLIAIHVPLRRWLGHLDRLQAFDGTADQGPQTAPSTPDDTPLELRGAFEALNRAARKREAALTALRGVLEGLMPGVVPSVSKGPAVGDTGGDRLDDIEVISHLISQLTLRLQERGAQLNAIFALSPDGFVSFDAAHCVNYVSPSFTRLTGLADAELIGLHEQAFTRQLCEHAGVRAGQLPSLAALRDDASPREGTRLLVDLERPRRRVVEVALRTGGSTVVSQVLHLRDVTHETELDQMKSEFLSTAAHELRTPMTSIFGFIELMLQRPLSAERQREVIVTVHRHSRLMIAIINELLDLARIEARRGKDFEIETLDLGELVDELVRDLSIPEGREAPQMELPAAPLWVAADRNKLRQAIGNVLGNAYKYSPQGGAVSVRLQRLPGSDDSARAGITVIDHGIGMTPEQLARVGERFYRADTSGNIPGTGLGMTIVKEIVELHGGQLRLSSTAGAGTEVLMQLPLAPAGTAAATAPAAPETPAAPTATTLAALAN